MKFYVINGPSINLLGIREPDIYGTNTYDDLINLINNTANENNIEIEILQSNIEGEIVNYIQDAYFKNIDGIIINPAAYTHTSIAILDALKAVKIPTIEVHISDISSREEFRKKSYISEICLHTISGEGILGYKKAILKMIEHLKRK